MVGIVGLIAVLTVVALSLVITRLATVALVLTGMSEEAARFQARSAYTGIGFTTRESEQVAGHPVRRRIVMILMILHNAGLVTIILSLILSFVDSGDGKGVLWRLLWLVGGVAVLWVLARSRLAGRVINHMVKWALDRWTDLEVRDYAGLLRLSGNYRVMELGVKEGDWLVGKSLNQCSLPEEGVNVLGIYREDGSYVGVPKGSTEVYPGDTLVLYGQADSLQELDARRAGTEGDRAHDEATEGERRRMARQDRQEAAHKEKREAEQQAREADERQESEQQSQSE